MTGPIFLTIGIPNSGEIFYQGYVVDIGPAKTPTQVGKFYRKRMAKIYSNMLRTYGISPNQPSRLYFEIRKNPDQQHPDITSRTSRYMDESHTTFFV